MAIVEMSKLNLVAMAYDKDALLNALQRTGATEIKFTAENEYTVPLCSDCEELSAELSGVENALETLTAHADAYEKENKIKSEKSAEIEITYSDFINAHKLKEKAADAVNSVNALTERKKRIIASLTKAQRSLETAAVYKDVDSAISGFCGTLNTKITLGSLPVAGAEILRVAENENPLLCFETLSSGETPVVVAAAHKSALRELDDTLQRAGFTACPFGGDSRTGTGIYTDTQAEISALNEELSAADVELYELKENLITLKIYADYLRFEVEKAQSTGKMRATQTTFWLEAYVPEGAQELVASAVREVTAAAYYEFEEPAADEVPPTLYKNNAVVKNFETITNIYSPPSSREIDPNTVMAFFYSLFLGFIMGDTGYGLLMLLGGGAIYLKLRAKDNGLKRLAGVFAIGGIFAIVWGLLFNSFFGTDVILPYTVMPNAKDDMYTFMGIKVPAVLVISMELGILQLMAGYIMRGVQCWRRGKYLDGIFDGIVWVLFSVGVGLAIVGLVEEANIPLLAYIGGITAGVMLVVAMCTAGRHEKILGKFTKGFGAAYGVINYASDILSYARLYGLMLSGAVIAQIISDYSIGFIAGGNPLFIILGVVLMIVGHAFNLGMGLLGAYIHDARLQYVEFYGRFFEGEGELFAPLGSQHKYVSVNNKQ